jgi:predicted transcriptional regulator
MPRKATTFRIEPVAMDGLVKLSAILDKPLNKLANEAIREYVARRSHALERELESTLEDLRAYRKRDPDFAQSIDKFIEAELAVRDDPAEGSVFIEDSETGEVGKTGPAQTAVLKALND